MAVQRSLCVGCARMRMRREQDLLGLDADYLSAGRESDVLETGAASSTAVVRERRFALYELSCLWRGDGGAVDSPEKVSKIQKAMEEMDFLICRLMMRGCNAVQQAAG